MIRTYTIRRPLFADGGPEVEHSLTILPETQWRAALAFWYPGPGAHVRVFDDLNNAKSVLADWTLQGWEIRIEDRELVDK